MSDAHLEFNAAQHLDVRAFLAAWFEHCPPNFDIELRVKHGQVLHSRRFTNIDAAERHIFEETLRGGDVYVGCLPRDRAIEGGGANACTVFSWAWVDVDYGSVGHAKPAKLPTADAAREALAALPTPSLLVNTGGGLHAWWRLSDGSGSVDLNRRIATAVNGDQASTDRARILRVPGTYNCKVQGQPRLTRLLDAGNALWNASDFDWLPEAEPPPPVPLRGGSGRLTGDLPFNRANAVPVVEVVQWLGIQLTENGGVWNCACFMNSAHSGTNPTQMQVGGKHNDAHCYSTDCAKSYSNVDIVAHLRGCSPREAVNLIASRFGFDGFPPERADRRGALAAVPPFEGGGSVLITTHGGDWQKKLIRTKSEALVNNPMNVAFILRDAPEWKGALAYDDLALRAYATRKQPTGRPGGFIGDDDITAMCGFLASEYHLNVGTDMVKNGMMFAARHATFNPVKQYLEALEWDGVPRIEILARDHLGFARDIEVEFLNKWLISAVARVFNPGCKVDTCLVLVGDQGMRKSSFFEALGAPWYSNTTINMQANDRFLQVHSKWIYELAEVDGAMARHDAELIKAFMSSAIDTFRAPYGSAIQDVRRMGVFCGTTNQTRFLSDETGSRRWWCCRVLRVVQPKPIRDMRNQVWAEAIAQYRSTAEPCWWFEDESVVMQANSTFATSTDDGWIDLLIAGLEGHNEMLSARILSEVLMVPPERHNTTNRKILAKCMRAIGTWEDFKDRKGMMGWRRK